jgi:hypothetical protein
MVTNRHGTVVHVSSGIPGSVQDVALFRDAANELGRNVAGRDGDQIAILGDK